MKKMNVRIQFMEAKQQWIPPAGLERSRLRPVQLTRAGRGLVVLALVLAAAALAAGIGLGLAASRQADEARMLREQGTVTDGRVTRLWRGRDKEHQPWMAYRFAGGEQTYEGSARVSLRLWRDLRVGSPIRIHYVPTRPELNNPFTASIAVMPGWVAFIVALGLAGGAVGAMLAIRSQRRLLSEGRPAPGLVTRHEKVRHGSHASRHESKYYYEFPLLSGAIARGAAGPTKNPPAVGSTIPLVYDRENPRRNAPYPFSLVRLPAARTR
jgi:hypothetical protein